VNAQPSPYAFVIGDKVLYDPMCGAQRDFLTAQETNVFLWGNRGGGKSITARMWCHGEALAHPGLIYIIVRRSYPELTKNHLIYLDDEMKMFSGTYNKTEHICYYPNGSIGFYQQCASLADVKKVVGAEAAIIVFDEAPEMEWDWLRLIGASVRVKSGSGLKPRVRYLGNPIGPSIDQLWSYFIDKDVNAQEVVDPEYFPSDWRSIEIRMEDNSHLDVAAYKKQFAGIPAHIRQAWVDGIRVVDGAYFIINPKTHHIKQAPRTIGALDALGFVHRPPYIYRTVDWGTNDAAICLWLALYPNKRAIVFKELIKTHTTAKEFARLIKEYTGEMPIRETFCDPTMFPPKGADVILAGNILESNGVALTPSRNDRVAAGFAISEWLNTIYTDGLPALQLWTPGCPYLTKTLPNMRTDPNNVGRIADHPRDHAVIGLGYFCMGQTVNPTDKQPTPEATAVSQLIHRIPLQSNAHMLGRESVRRPR
jgi:hypothetical protein